MILFLLPNIGIFALVELFFFLDFFGNSRCLVKNSMFLFRKFFKKQKCCILYSNILIFVFNNILRYFLRFFAKFLKIVN